MSTFTTLVHNIEYNFGCMFRTYLVTGGVSLPSRISSNCGMAREDSTCMGALLREYLIVFKGDMKEGGRGAGAEGKWKGKKIRAQSQSSIALDPLDI